MNEIELTPGDEAEIRRIADLLDLNPEQLRYYYQFGPGAPTPPAPSRRARRWLRRLNRIPD